MQAYILSVAGAVLLSAVVSLILPEGKLAPLIRGMTKLITLVLLVSPLISLLRGEVFFSDGETVAEDEDFLLSCTQRVEENDEQAIAAWLEEEFGVSALSEVQLETDGSYSNIRGRGAYRYIVADREKTGSVVRLPRGGPLVKDFRALFEKRTVRILLFGVAALLLLLAIWRVFFAGEAVSGYDETQQEARISAMLERVEGIVEASVMIVEEEGEAVSCIVVYRGEDSILSRMRILDIASSALGIAKEKVQVYLS